MRFTDRHDAGKKLLSPLHAYKDDKNAIVIGLPRGGVVTAWEVAHALHLPLDIICPRKVGAPHNPELAIGAVCATGEAYFNDGLIADLGVSPEYIDQEVAKERKLSRMRLDLYRKGRPPLDLKGKTAILVDDGLATGATMRAAIQSVRALDAKKIVVAVPVSPPDTATAIRALCDACFCLLTPVMFYAVGQFYVEFGQTEDEEVMALLSQP